MNATQTTTPTVESRSFAEMPGSNTYFRSVETLAAVTPVTRQWKLIVEAASVVQRNMHARADWLRTGDAEKQAAFDVAAMMAGMEADGFSLRRLSDGSCPDDDE